MFKMSVTLMCGLLMGLSACSKEERYVIKANDGQIGKGATIEMVGKNGKLHVDPIPGWPQGLDATVTETENVDGLTSKMWGVTSDKHVNLSFIIGAGKYICTTCQPLGLPENWHREQRPE